MGSFFLLLLLLLLLLLRVVSCLFLYLSLGKWSAMLVLIVVFGLSTKVACWAAWHDHN